MNNPYDEVRQIMPVVAAASEFPTEDHARDKELALILWTLCAEGNVERAKRLRDENSPYRHLDGLRAKLTSWPALFSKRYEVARALALGWWHQLTPKEQGSVIDFTAILVIGSGVVLFFVWMATR